MARKSKYAAYPLRVNTLKNGLTPWLHARWRVEPIECTTLSLTKDDLVRMQLPVADIISDRISSGLSEDCRPYQGLLSMNMGDGTKVMAADRDGTPARPYICAIDGRWYVLIHERYRCKRCDTAAWNVRYHVNTITCNRSIADKIAHDTGLKHIWSKDIFEAVQKAGLKVRRVMLQEIYLVPPEVSKIMKLYHDSALKDSMSITEFVAASLSTVGNAKKD